MKPWPPPKKRVSASDGPAEVLTTADLDTVTIDQSGDPKKLLYGKRRRARRSRR